MGARYGRAFPFRPHLAAIYPAAAGNFSRTATDTLLGADTAIVAPIPMSGLTGWWDASDASTITGSPASQWNDKSGNARHFTQATSGSRPATGTRTLKSLNVLDFDG